MKARVKKMNTTENTNKLNWNGLTDKQQEFIKKIVDDEVLTLCNELADIGLKHGIKTDFGVEFIEFENSLDEEGEPKEIMQFFIVSDWLANHLRINKACVSRFLDFQIWGRCEFGQSLVMDSDLKAVIQHLI
jgi:hypothetical protein